MVYKQVKMQSVQPSDVEKLLHIGRQTFYEAFGPPHNSEENITNYLNEKITLDNIVKEINNPKSKFYFAIINKEIAGYIKINFDYAQTEPINNNSMEIERIYVLKEFQGKKIGQLFLEYTVKIAKQKEIDFIWLGVWEKNIDAIRFYKRNDFKQFDTHQFLLGTDLQTDIIMKLEL
ncbi:GNAT family N-acetyltransferase [Aquimarina muelleri]|uniref:GNAT family N-acetyltransferase n=1 Tax=Aquimarina muelleri TaxID=279356 RepID=UPI003F68672D